MMGYAKMKVRGGGGRFGAVLTARLNTNTLVARRKSRVDNHLADSRQKLMRGKSVALMLGCSLARAGRLVSAFGGSSSPAFNHFQTIKCSSPLYASMSASAATRLETVAGDSIGGSGITLTPAVRTIYFRRELMVFLGGAFFISFVHPAIIKGVRAVFRNSFLVANKIPTVVCRVRVPRSSTVLSR